MAFGGGFPDIKSFLAILQAWFACCDWSHDILFENPTEVLESILQFFAPSSTTESIASLMNLWTEQPSVQSGGALDWRSENGLSLALPLMCLDSTGVLLIFFIFYLELLCFE